MHGAEPTQSREGPHEVFRSLGGGEGCLLLRWKLPQLLKQHLQDVIYRITISVYRMSGQLTLQIFPSFYELERNRHSHLNCMKRMPPLCIHRNPAMAQLFSQRKPVLLSCVKGMLLSLGGGPGPCFQESCKDHPQSAGNEHSVVQCFLMGTQSNFLLSVKGSPSVG